MGGKWKLAAAAAVPIVLLPLSVVMVAVGAVLAGPGYSCVATNPDSTEAARSRGDGSWTAEQVNNAVVIVEVGADMGVPSYGWVIAVATAMQESSVRNLPHLGDRNDHDSLGLFQQRPSQGWGTPEQIMNPRYAAKKFYEALLRVDGWQNMPLTQAAQAVQRSAYPDAYAKWQSEAQRLVDVAIGRLGIVCSGAGGPWVLPLPEGSFAFVSPFGSRWGRMHRGVDLAAPTGTPILAASAGTVVAAACTSPYCDRPGSLSTPGCGWTVKIDHGGGIGTMYCHAVALNVTVGQHVNAGDVIGWVGSTGHSSGPHLHFQVHRGEVISNDTAIDPVPFLASVGISLT